MTTSLFSTYQQGENRVTSTFLAVLERLSLPNINRILGSLIEADFDLVSFENQPKRKHSTPDAVIGTGQSIVIETKTDRNALSSDQIERELKDLRDGETLLLLTPDENRPPLLRKDHFRDDHRVAWANFITLANEIKAILNDDDDENEPPSEREAFLLREFMRMIQQRGLLFSAEDRVLVIAARIAYPLYKQLGAYITQPQTFRPSGYIAFYADRMIQSVVPKINLTIDSVKLTPEGISRLDSETARDLACELRQRILCLKDPRADYAVSDGYTAKVLFLSAPDDEETINLKMGSIIHEGRAAFVQKHRYLTLESLKKAFKTSELERG